MISFTYPLLLSCGFLFTVYSQSVSTCPDSDRSEQCICSRNVDVAIVGAGPSGSYSAYRLRNENLRVEVFEYFNRVGGRLYSAVLPDAPDVYFDLGGMIFSPQQHKRVFKVVEDLGLPIKNPPVSMSDSQKPGVYWGGKQVNLGAESLLYELNEAERSSPNVIVYLFEKLTGENLANLTLDSLRKVKLLDGRNLYSVPLDEALDLVASKAAKTLLYNTAILSSLAGPDTSLLFWETIQETIKFSSVPGYYKTPVKGMNAIPKGLMDAFLRSSARHQLSLNRRLLSISPRSNGTYYKLVFRHTETTPTATTELDSSEVVCAKKIILAINKFALSKVQWDPLRDSRVQVAINAVRNIPAHKVFLSFPVDWWVQYSTYPRLSMFSDRPFNHFSQWDRSASTGHYVVMASYCDEGKALFLHQINSQGQVINGSTPGSNQVTQGLLDRLLFDLSGAFGIDRKLIPEPVSGISQFWNSYPFGGGWTVWRAGYFYDDVISTVQRPSLTDDVFYVNADHSKGQNPGWTEGALEAVDRVFEKYFL